MNLKIEKYWTICILGFLCCTIGIRCIYWDGKSTVQSLEGLWREERGFFSKKVWGTHNYALIKSFAFLGHHL